MGLGVSIFLAILAVVLTRTPPNSETNNPVDSTGILEIGWILRSRPEIQQRLGQVDEPSTNNLRKAAMFPVVLAHVGAGEMERGGDVDREGEGETGYTTYRGSGSEFVPLRRIGSDRE